MPIYRYQCSKCGEFEVIQSASAKPVKCNPECTEKNCPKDAEKLISRPTFQLVGEGWYKDLYSKKGGSEKKNTGEKSSDDSSSESKKSDDGDKKKKKGSGCGPGCGCH